MAEEWASGRWYADHDPTVSGESKVGFLAGYQAAKPQWISVKDRLPDFDVWCVWWSFDQRCENGIGRREVGDSLDWWSDYDYWWELPEPPKEEA